MKHLFLFTIMSALFINLSFAETGESSTECIMMQEQTVRNNPKENLDSQPKPKTKTSSAVQM